MARQRGHDATLVIDIDLERVADDVLVAVSSTPTTANHCGFCNPPAARRRIRPNPAAPVWHAVRNTCLAGDARRCTIVVMTGDQMRRTALPKLTYEDFLSFPDDGRRHELIDGDHYVTPSPVTVHQRLVGRLFAALHTHLAGSGRGEAFLAPFDVVLSDHDVVEPDLLVVLRDQRHILTSQHVRGAPAIVIEILSPGTRRRDETLKRQLYARTGVREYWMIDPDRAAIVVCRQAAPGVLETAAELTAAAGDVLASPLLPGLSVALAAIFEPGAIEQA